MGKLHEHSFKIYFLTNEYVTSQNKDMASQHKDLTSQHNYLTSDGRKIRHPNYHFMCLS